MIDKIITIEEIMEFKPCYVKSDLKKFQARYGFPEKMTLDQILNCGHNSDDILWLVLRPEIIPENILHELACKFAEKALFKMIKNGNYPDTRSWWAINAKRLWMQGKITDIELSSAADAAYAASDAVASAYAASDAVASAYAASDAVASAYAASAYAASNAASDAVASAYAASDAAYAAACAASAAAYAAACAASAAAASKLEQLQIVIEELNKRK